MLAMNWSCTLLVLWTVLVGAGALSEELRCLSLETCESCLHSKCSWCADGLCVHKNSSGLCDEALTRCSSRDSVLSERQSSLCSTLTTCSGCAQATSCQICVEASGITECIDSTGDCTTLGATSLTPSFYLSLPITLTFAPGTSAVCQSSLPGGVAAAGATWIVATVYNAATHQEIIDIIVIVTNNLGLSSQYTVSEFVFNFGQKRDTRVEFSLNVPNAQSQANADLRQLYSDVVANPSLLPSNIALTSLVTSSQANSSQTFFPSGLVNTTKPVTTSRSLDSVISVYSSSIALGMILLFAL